MRRRILMVLLLSLVLALALAPAALAHDGGQGTYGPADDVVVTNAGFIVIAFVPIFVGLASLIHWRLDKRRYARKAAKGGSSHHRGGW